MESDTIVAQAEVQLSKKVVRLLDVSAERRRATIRNHEAVDSGFEAERMEMGMNWRVEEGREIMEQFALSQSQNEAIKQLREENIKLRNTGQALAEIQKALKK